MLRIWLSAAFSVALLLGCGGGEGPELGSVEGTVTLDGDPLPNATVTFTPRDGGRLSIGITDDDGHYELKHTPSRDGALIGKHRVTITTASSKTGADGNDIEIPEKLPANYNAETELERDVEAGSNEFDFELDSKGRIYKEGDEKREISPTCC